ncbi:glycosyltransferase family 4 protein [Roseateles albus]|uniref:Glycosyltransferase family 4 protein n=1 Tax=Roseateles albus TaxID=2987525 RepID=A0ABT5KIE0_9BURK|nr:glycosyltransferase family 4 protein [Roseateles albus]MDC8773254.1 glycosyltransferase family 4 protein [Roseateles albus]
MRTLCIEGWRGINHSIAMVNQNQILEMVKHSGWRICHRDVSYFLPHWNSNKLDSGFSAEESAIIAGLPAPGGEPIDVCLRIASPVRLGEAGSARRNVTFVVTEFGLTGKSFEPAELSPNRLTVGDDIVITPSQWSCARLLDYGFAPDKVKVVPHGFKADTFHPMTSEEREQARLALGVKPHETVFCNVGVATWNKGLDLLILAFAQLRLLGLPVRLILKDHKGLYGLGVESIFAELTSRMPQLNSAQVRDGISILSTSLNLSQIRSLYCLSDAYVSPYRAEGFNLPVLEAMGCGTHVIVSGGGATDDFVSPALSYQLSTRPGTTADQPQVHGQFVMPELEDLIHAMRLVVDRQLPNPALRKQAREQLAQEYSWATVTHQLMALL